MKVMCINDNWVAPEGLLPEECPKFGDICTVINTDKIQGSDFEFYTLQEFEGWFRTNHFAPLSEIEETINYELHEHEAVNCR